MIDSELKDSGLTTQNPAALILKPKNEKSIMNPVDFARSFVSSLMAGDIEKARAAYHPDCVIWHNFSNQTQTVDENLELLQKMLAVSKKLEYIVTRLEEIENGYLQLHTLQMTANDGNIYSTDACLVVTLKDGKIASAKEWIDPTPLAPIFAKA